MDSSIGSRRNPGRYRVAIAPRTRPTQGGVRTPARGSKKAQRDWGRVEAHFEMKHVEQGVGVPVDFTSQAQPLAGLYARLNMVRSYAVEVIRLFRLPPSLLRAGGGWGVGGFNCVTPNGIFNRACTATESAAGFHADGRPTAGDESHRVAGLAAPAPNQRQASCRWCG